MNQVFQNLSNGELIIEDIPCPQIKDKMALIETNKSVISLGTERMLLKFGKAGYLNKAKQQPDKVKQVLEKLKNDGILETWHSISSKLSKQIPLGYCNAGKVIETNINNFSIGDRVVSNGNHAEIVSVPKNLIAKIPDNVDDETAAFTVLGAIALQGIRLLGPTLGETIIVQGLGLVGQLSVQILKANGCNVIGIDFDSSRCKLAEEFGANTIDLSIDIDPVDYINSVTKNIGADGVLVCTASDDDDIIHKATKMCRKRGRIILIGTAGLKLFRDDFFKKEILFQVSSSYGPGRYDSNYEIKGNDYPIGFVRWTEQRNFSAILQLMSEDKINVKPLITHQFPFKNIIKAYDLLEGKESSLGIVINYNSDKKLKPKNKIKLSSEKSFNKDNVTVGFIGAGNYAGSVLIPIFNSFKVNLKTIASINGVNSTLNGKKYGFQNVTTNINSLFDDEEIDAIVIATQHDTHADYAIKALEKGKHIFVEKPLALNHDELDLINSNFQKTESKLMIGFNRRFSPFIKKMKQILLSHNSEQISMIFTVNAGSIPNDHWTQDMDIGGGRILGEACHFIDLASYLAGSEIIESSRTNMLSENNDTTTIQLKFKNGSIASIHYFSNGSRLIPKERIEVYFGGKAMTLDNYRKLNGFNINGLSKIKKIRQDKGQANCIKAFIDAIKNNSSSPIPFNEILNVSRVSIDLKK